MILFTSLIFFPHLSAVRLKKWTEITLFTDTFTRGFLFFFFIPLSCLFFSRNTKNTTQGTQRKKGNDLSIYSSIVFFSFFLIFTEVDRESFDLEQQGCCFAQPVLPSLEMEIRVTRKYFPASRPGPRSVANKIKQSRLRVTF